MALFRREYRAEAVAASLVLMALVLLALPDARQDALSQSVHHTLLLPFSQLRARFAGYVGLREENERLREEVQRARIELAAATVYRAETDVMRRLLGFAPDQPVQFRPARVVDRDFETLPTTFLIDVGRRDGIAENLPVVTADGLVGKTANVGGDATVVMLYTHPEFSASALLVGGDHLEYGVVRPAPEGELHLFLPLRSSSGEGDRIVTSGYGGSFPRGIPLGRVAGLRQDRRLGLQRIDVVDPEVELGSVTMVFVLMRRAALGASAGDVPRLFWPGYAYPPMEGEGLGAAAAASDSVAGEPAPAEATAP